MDFVTDPYTQYSVSTRNPTGAKEKGASFLLSEELDVDSGRCLLCLYVESNNIENTCTIL